MLRCIYSMHVSRGAYTVYVCILISQVIHNKISMCIYSMYAPQESYTVLASQDVCIIRVLLLISGSNIIIS